MPLPQIDPQPVEGYDILRCEDRETPWGPCFRVRIHRDDKDVMSFAELWKVFQAAYPGWWGIQSFPPASRFIDQANKYHLMTFPQPPPGLDLID